MLHGGPQHPHPHRRQQQLQRDVGVHARPEGGADAGQQTRGLSRFSGGGGRSLVHSHFTLDCVRQDDKRFQVPQNANHVFFFVCFFDTTQVVKVNSRPVKPKELEEITTNRLQVCGRGLMSYTDGGSCTWQSEMIYNPVLAKGDSRAFKSFSSSLV